MLPSEEAFAAVVSALGISNNDGVVVYDGKGLFSAARVWWWDAEINIQLEEFMFLIFVRELMKSILDIEYRMFRVFGHDRIWVLDGGLPKWRTLGYDVESSASGDAILKATAASEAIEKIYQGQAVSSWLNVFYPILVYLVWRQLVPWMVCAI